MKTETSSTKGAKATTQGNALCI